MPGFLRAFYPLKEFDEPVKKIEHQHKFQLYGPETCIAKTMQDPIDTKQLKNFCEIVISRSMGKAAKNLNLTSSAVSHSVKRLEEDLGCKLFDRNGQNLTLTYSGERLFALATDLLSDLSKARSIMQDLFRANQDTLRIGATPAACQYIIPIALRELKESITGINVQIIQATTYDLIDAVEEMKVDVAIFPYNKITKKHFEPIGTDSLEFIVNPFHPWANGDKITAASIEAQKIIISGTKGYTYDIINKYFRDLNINITPFIEVSNEEVIKRLVELDIGIGILPNWMIKNEKNSNKLLSFPLGNRKLNRHWAIAHRDVSDKAFAETLIIGVVTNVTQSLFSDLLQ